MNYKTFNQLEQKAIQLFGKKSSVMVAKVRASDKGYVVRIKMQGMPFEISAMQDTLEKAEEIAFGEFEKRMNEALENTLFPTQPNEKYKEIKLTEEQLEKLFRYEEILSSDYRKEIESQTIAKVCQLDSGVYECIIQSPYMCLNARGRSKTEKYAIIAAMMVAHDVFDAVPIYVGNRFNNK